MILMLMTIGGISLAVVLLMYSLWAKKNWLRTFVLRAVAVWVISYGVMLFAFSLLSKEKTLEFNEPKAFCGFYLDCHLHASVVGVRKAKTFGRLRASNEFYIVKVKVSSDAKLAALELTLPKFTVVDAQGRRFEPTEDLTVSMPHAPFEEKIPAGGKIVGEIAFDLSSEAQNPRLDIREGSGLKRAIEAVLIGDEDSVLHKRNYFRLETNNQAAVK